jgi:hypothetical protein
MGHGPDPQLEQRRLDRPAAARRRQDRAAVGAGPASWWWPTRPRQPVQGAERRARPAAADAPRARHRLRAHNFPTDLYIAESLARERGFELRWSTPTTIAAQLDGARAC